MKSLKIIVLTLFVIALYILFLKEKPHNSEFQIVKKENESELVATEIQSEKEIIVPFGESHSISNTVSFSNQKLSSSYKIINLDITKICNENFILTDSYEENYYDENMDEILPYSKIADKKMNLITDFSYVLITIKVIDNNIGWQEENSELYRESIHSYALGNWELKCKNGFISCKGYIDDEKISNQGILILEQGEEHQITLIFIVRDEYLNDMYLYLTPLNRQERGVYFDLGDIE